MGKYMLITVCERDVSTELFDSHAAAHDKMLEELGKEYIKEGDQESWDALISKYPLEYCGYADFEYTAYSAWSNLDDDLNCDWLIVKVSDVAPDAADVFTVGFAVSGRTRIRVKANGPEDAKDKASDEVCELDFGPLEDVEWEAKWVEDADGKRIDFASAGNGGLA